MRSIDQLLAEAPIFEGLGPDQLELIAGCARNEGFEAGAVLFRENAPADTFYVVRRGAIALELHVPSNGEIVIDTVGAGEVAGFSWLVPPYRWRYDGRATEPTRVIAFDGACLRGKCESDCALGYALMKRFANVLSERLHDSLVRLVDVYGAPVS